MAKTLEDREMFSFLMSQSTLRYINCIAEVLLNLIKNVHEGVGEEC